MKGYFFSFLEMTSLQPGEVNKLKFTVNVVAVWVACHIRKSNLSDLHLEGDQWDTKGTEWHIPAG